MKIHPTPGHRLAADQAALVEQPGVLGVELLERVVGQHLGADALGHPQQEGVPPAHGPGRGRHELGVGHGLVEGLALGGVDPVPEGGVDHDDDLVPGNSAWNCRTASSSWARLGTERPSVAMFDPSTTT